MLTVQEATSLASLLRQRIYGSRVPSVRGCPHCGILINHTDGCKHMVCEGCGHTKLMHQSVTAATRLRTLLSDHEGHRKAANTGRPLEEGFQDVHAACKALVKRPRLTRCHSLAEERKDTTMEHLLGYGKTGYSYGVVKMDSGWKNTQSQNAARGQNPVVW